MKRQQHTSNPKAQSGVKKFNPYRMFTGVWIPDPLLRYKGISIGAKVVYARLARFAGKDGRCFPSVKAIAKHVALSERQVQTYLKQLDHAGFIEREPVFTDHGQTS